MLTWPGTIDSPFNNSLSSLATLATQVQLVVSYVISHPVWTIIVVALTIGLLQIAVDLIKRVVKAGLTLILKLPFTLSQWIWQRAMTSPVSSKDQIEQLMERLDALQKEQEKTVAELKSLLSKTKMTGRSNSDLAPAKVTRLPAKLPIEKSAPPTEKSAPVKQD